MDIHINEYGNIYIDDALKMVEIITYHVNKLYNKGKVKSKFKRA